MHQKSFVLYKSSFASQPPFHLLVNDGMTIPPTHPNSQVDFVLKQTD